MRIKFCIKSYTITANNFSKVDHMSDSKPINKPLNMYAGIHKGQRSALFQLSMRAGALDHNDMKYFKAFRDDLAELRNEFRLHVKNEETYVHPFLIERVPGAAKDLKDDHKNVERMFDELVSHFDGILSKSMEFKKLGELCLEFYRALNRFISFYLVHINKEEEYIQPALWTVCTGDELWTTMGRILAGLSPQEAMRDLNMMIPADNIDGLSELFLVAKDFIPPEGFKAACDLAQRLLNPAAWASLKSRIDSQRIA